jgi:ATP-dependent helicase/DNAse subunit B
VLLVPTATMAEHLRNELAREGLVFRPDAVATFSKFVAEFVRDKPPLTTSALELTVADLLRTLPLPRFAPLRDANGFRRSVVSAVEEFSSAGGTLNQLRRSGVWQEFVDLYEVLLERVLEKGGGAFRGERLHLAASRIEEADLAGIDSVLIAGFFAFTQPELAVLRALSGKCRLTITLPEWDGSQPALAALRQLPDCTERQVAPDFGSDPHQTVAPAATADQEASAIARMIIEERESGRPFREIGVIVRSEEPYVSVLKSAFARFSIPARFYFGTPLSGHPAIRYLSGLIEAMLGGWDYQTTLGPLRIQGSRLAGPAGDGFEYRVLSALPGKGLAGLRALAPVWLGAFFDELTALEAWRDDTAMPTVWAKRCKRLRRLYDAPEISPRTHEDILLWREHAAALNGFEAALDEAAAYDDSVRIDCREFWNRVLVVLDGEALRPPDHRRDVVHVIDATEARQWKLPVVFVCGLLEKHFPRYHAEDPILGDSVRLQLRGQGVWLSTSSERQEAERFLFNVAVSRARERIIFTYPKLNAKGEENLPSFYLDSIQTIATEAPEQAVRPRPLRPRAAEPQPHISGPAMLTLLAEKHARIRATGVESYLQCPYQFFASCTLNLHGPPERVWDRLNPPAQGSIAHKVLELAVQRDCRISDVFDEAFDSYCLENNVPDGYRREAIRLELQYNLQLLENDKRLQRGQLTLVEQPFSLQLDERTVIAGRIDRMEVDDEGRVTVIDYKYRSQVRTKDTKRTHEEDRTLVQGGLYLLAVPQLGNYVPAGMVYCGFKRDVTYAGWVLRPNVHEFGEDCSDDTLQSLMINAREDALRAAAEIRDGRIRPHPANEEQCEFCAYAQVCRVESMPAAAVAGKESR